MYTALDFLRLWHFYLDLSTLETDTNSRSKTIRVFSCWHMKKTANISKSKIYVWMQTKQNWKNYSCTIIIIVNIWVSQMCATEAYSVKRKREEFNERRCNVTVNIIEVLKGDEYIIEHVTLWRFGETSIFHTIEILCGRNVNDINWYGRLTILLFCR